MKSKDAGKCITALLLSGLIIMLSAFSGCSDDDVYRRTDDVTGGDTGDGTGSGAGDGGGDETGDGTSGGTGGAADTVNDGTFYATNLTNGAAYAVTADIVYNGTRCKVYKDRNDTGMNANAAAAMGQEFDNNIYGLMVNTFGTASDVDGDGKITILVLDIKDGGSDTSYVAGYFDPVNEFDSATSAETRYSNERDMLYMDSNPGADYPSAFKETMAHEFQHLISFNQKVFVQGSETGFDAWIDEGLSSAAERIYTGSQITDKIDYFNTGYSSDIAKG